MAITKSKYATGKSVPRADTAPAPKAEGGKRRAALAKIRELLPQIRERADEKSMLEKLLKKDMEELKQAMIDANTEKLVHDGLRATRFKSSSPRINKTKLLQNKVPIDVIERCTDLNPYETVRVSQ